MTPCRQCLLIGTVAALCAGSVFAQSSVEGRVLDSESGEPLRRATVMLLPVEPGVSEAPPTGSTDASGRFTIPVTRPGRYRIRAERNGYVRPEFSAMDGPRSAQFVTVEEGQPVKGIEIRLKRHAVVTGRVTDDEGEPVANAHVEMMRRRYVNGKPRLMPAGFSTTNDLGEYRAFGLPPGQYYVSASVRSLVGAVALPRSPGESEQALVPTWHPGATEPASATQVQAVAGRVVSNVDIRIRRAPVFRIRGRVKSDQEMTQRTTVHLLAGDSRPFDGLRSMSATAQDGTFELKGVTAGAYTITTEVSIGQERLFGYVPVEVRSANVDGVEVPLVPAQDLAVTLRVEGDGAGDVPAGLRVAFEPASAPMGIVPVHPDARSGAFLVKGLAPGAYRVTVAHPSMPVYVRSIHVGSQAMPDRQVAVLPGADTAIEIVVSTQGGTISGSVKTDQGAAAPGVTVVLAPDTARRGQPDLYRTAITDDSGGFTLKAIPPGDYKLFAWDNPEQGQWLDPDFLQAHETKGKSIAITEKSQEAVDLGVIRVGDGQ